MSLDDNDDDDDCYDGSISWAICTKREENAHSFILHLFPRPTQSDIKLFRRIETAEEVRRIAVLLPVVLKSIHTPNLFV